MCGRRLSRSWCISLLAVFSLLQATSPVGGEPTEGMPSQSQISSQSSQNETDLLNLLDSLSEMLLSEAKASTLESRESRLSLERLLEQQKAVLSELAASRTEVSELRNSLAESQARYERSVALSKEAEEVALRALKEAEAKVAQKEKALRIWRVVGLSGWGTVIVLFFILLF